MGIFFNSVVGLKFVSLSSTSSYLCFTWSWKWKSLPRNLFANCFAIRRGMVWPWPGPSTAREGPRIWLRLSALVKQKVFEANFMLRLCLCASSSFSPLLHLLLLYLCEAHEHRVVITIEEYDELIDTHSQP